VIKSNTPKYLQGDTLSKKAKIKLDKGEFLALKAPNRSQTFRIEGPYEDTKAGGNCKKDTLVETLKCIVTAAETKCEIDSLTGILKCITGPTIIPRTETETSKDRQLVKELWGFVQRHIFTQMAPAKISQKSHTKRIEVPAEPWVLVASLDKNFCYPSNKPLTIWQPDSLADKLVLFARSTDKQPITKGVTDLDNIFIITLHPMPDDKTFPSNTYKVVWMAEKGCYRQAQLLLLPTVR
jgi:hypothetical protein